MSRDQARRLLREYFVGEGADALAALGFAPPKDARGVTQLASIPRLELILDTNVRMAQETGHWQKWKRMSKAYPYGIWRVGVCDNHRKSHLERDGKVYAFDHPIWTQSPPGGEFHCHCRRELATEEDLEDMGVKPQPNDSSFEPSSLGFDPSADDFPKPPVGKRVPEPIAEKAEQKMQEDEERLAKEQESIRKTETTEQERLEAERLEAERLKAEHKAHREEQRQRAFENRQNKFKQDILGAAPPYGNRQMYEQLADSISQEYTPEMVQYGKPPKVFFAQDAVTQITKNGLELLIGNDVRGQTVSELVENVKSKINFAESMRKGSEWRKAFAIQQKQEAALISRNTKIKSEGFSRDNVLEKTNPNHRLGRQWQINCQRCVMTQEARRRGLDVTALPNTNTDNLARPYHAEGWPTVFENTTASDFIDVHGNNGDKVKDNIIKKMKEFGEGARAIVEVVWNQGNRMSGHVFNVENYHGQIIFYDTQTNTPDASSYFSYIISHSVNRFKNPNILRTDNRRFSSKIKDCCKPI